MESIIFYKLYKEQVLFQPSGLLSEIRKNFPVVPVFDLDNYSESLMFEYASRLIKESDKTAIIFEQDEDATNKVSLFHSDILKYKDKIFVVTLSDNSIIMKLKNVLPQGHFLPAENHTEIFPFLEKNFSKPS